MLANAISKCIFMKSFYLGIYQKEAIYKAKEHIEEPEV